MSDSFEDMELDFSQSFDREEQVTAPEFPAEGIFHSGIDFVDAANDKAPGAAFLTFKIFCGNVDDQQGKIVRYVVWPPHPNSTNPELAKKQWMQTIAQLMLALGMRQPGEFPKIVINQGFWESMLGKQCFTRITHKEKTSTSDGGSKTTHTEAVIKYRTDFIPLFDESCSEVPYDADAAMIGGYSKDGGGI